MGSSKSKETVRTLCFNLDSEQGKGKDRFIVLENFSIHGRKVTGIVSMKNFDQNEDMWEVKVRFTLNSWDSYNDKTCECIEDEEKTKMGGIKRFKFEVNVPVGNSLEYAIFCRNAMNSIEFWDNNDYKNYKFSEFSLVLYERNLLLRGGEGVIMLFDQIWNFCHFLAESLMDKAFKMTTKD
eukprot:gene13789-4718_t